MSAMAATGLSTNTAGMPESMSTAPAHITILRAFSTGQPRRISQPEIAPPVRQPMSAVRNGIQAK